MVSWIKVTDIQCIIERAGELIKEVYDKRNFNVELKRDNTPVTEADKVSSEYITSALKKLYPEIPVISEEASLPAYEEREKLILNSKIGGIYGDRNNNFNRC